MSEYLRNYETDARYLETLGELKREGIIQRKSPLWWSTDYAPDPREVVTFVEFQRRLVDLGECKFQSYKVGSRKRDIHIRDVRLYNGEAVPISILDLKVGNRPIKFLVTARPYHAGERKSEYASEATLDEYPTIADIDKKTQKGGVIELHAHFLPHIRGVFAGRRGTHYFWYPLTFYPDGNRAFTQQLDEALDRKGLDYMLVYDPPMKGRPRRYSEVWDELMGKPGLVDQRRPMCPDFEFEEVSAEEMFRDYAAADMDLLVYYPLKVEDLVQTLPVVVATRTHRESKVRKLAVLGAFAVNWLHGCGQKGGILRIRNYELATEISRKVSADFGLPVDVVYYTPQPGRPGYERVSADAACWLE